MRGRVMIYVAAVVAVVVIAGVVVICSMGGDDTPSGAYTAQFELSMAGLLPKDTSDALNLRLVDREQHLVADCMHHGSFQYAPVDPHSVIDTTTETDFTSLSYAQRYGFGISAWPVFQPDRSGNETYRAALLTSKQKSYDNTLEQCADNAKRQADREFGVSVATDRFNATNDRVQRDPRFVEARHEWQSCAQRRGYSYPNRDTLIATFRNDYNSILDTAGVSSSLTGEADSQHHAEQNPQYQQFREREITAAVDTFPCSQDLDSAYAKIYAQLTPRQ